MCFHACVSYISSFVFKEAQGYAEENDILFMETSALALLDVNASEIFVAVGVQ